MKKKDLIIVGGVAFIAALISFVASSAIFGSPKKNPVKVPVVQPISSSFPSPQTDDNYKKFFNENALNPTQLIQIGGNNNKTPFQGGGSGQ
jgi:hypothetical protein